MRDLSLQFLLVCLSSNSTEHERLRAWSPGHLIVHAPTVTRVRQRVYIHLKKEYLYVQPGLSSSTRDR